MRMPLRVHITWADDWTLKIDTDAGQQTRLLRFRPRERAAWTRVRGRGRPSRRGKAAACCDGAWDRRTPPRAVERHPGRHPRPARYGALKVVTTAMRPGYLRRNGVPYSENAVVTEYFDRHGGAGFDWFTVTTVVEDPKYLAEPFVTSSSFKREADGTKWRPTPCEIVLPPS